MLRTSMDLMKENSFKLAKVRSRRYPAQTITDVDYTDDITLLANTPVQVESRLHSLERAAGAIGLHVNADKTEYMRFKQSGEFSTRKGGPLKLVDKFPLPKKECLINRKCHQHVTSKGMDSNRLAIGHMEFRPDRLNKTQFF